jgi:hypothetical protein
MALSGVYRVDFLKEWFRGGDLNGFSDIQLFPVSGDGSTT